MAAIAQAISFTSRPAAQAVRSSSKRSALEFSRAAFSQSPLNLRSNKAARASRSLQIRAARSDDEGLDVEQLVKDLQDRWDRVENKTAVAVYGVGAVVLLWFSSTIVSAVNSVPLVPKLLELVGLGYTSWFVYRYLLFKSSRQELIQDVDELKKKITGAAEEATSSSSNTSSKNLNKTSKAVAEGKPKEAASRLSD
ncbi:hypothetical protein ABBQ38_010323 [Trebouxia sp. C0009 RCD-2024]